MKKIMYYDLLLLLCFQSVKLHYQQAEIKKMQSQLKVIKRLSKEALNDDTLEAVHSKNYRKSQFDVDYLSLIKKFKERDPRAELVVELKDSSRFY